MGRLFRKSLLKSLKEKDDLELIAPNRHKPFFWPSLALVSFFVLAVSTWALTASIPLTLEARGLVLPVGGVREVVSLGQGVVVSLEKRGGEDVRAGDVLYEVATPAGSAAYENARALYKAETRRLQQQLAAIEQKHGHTIARIHQRLENRREMKAAFMELRKDYEVVVAAFAAAEDASLEEQQVSLSAIKNAYEDLQLGMKSLRDKGLLSMSTHIQFMHRQSSSLQAASQVDLAIPRARVTRERNRRELVQLQDQIENVAQEIFKLEGDLLSAQEQREVELAGLQIQRLKLEQSLLDAERNLWVNATVVSPYDGRLVAARKNVGQTVTANEPVALLEMATQSRKLMLSISPRSAGGTIRLAREGQTVDWTVPAMANGILTPETEKTLLDALAVLLPESSLSVELFGNRAIVSAGQTGFSQIEGLSIAHSRLADAEDLPVFALLTVIGDKWQSGDLVNIALVDPQDAKRIAAGMTAYVRPDFEKPLIGSQALAEVATIGEYVATSIEAEALVGSRELAATMAAERSGTAIVLTFERGPNDAIVWSGATPGIPLTIGATTNTFIQVEHVRPIEILIPHLNRIFSN